MKPLKQTRSLERKQASARLTRIYNRKRTEFAHSDDPIAKYYIAARKTNTEINRYKRHCRKIADEFSKDPKCAPSYSNIIRS